MSSLFASLTTAANTLSTHSRALTVIQNNLANASTPGYARQRVSLEAAPFDLSAGLVGGVNFGGVQTMRDDFAEQTVRFHASAFSSSQEVKAALEQIEGLFDPTQDSTIGGSMRRLFDSFSNWATGATDGRARQLVLDQAASVARSFNDTALYLRQSSANAHREISGAVTAINGLVSQLAELAPALRVGEDAGAEARFYQKLDELSELANITVNRGADGSVQVLLGGQTPLLINNEARLLPTPVETPPASGAPYQQGNPTTKILDAGGNDVTSLVTGGKLGGLLELRNKLLPTLIGDGSQQGQLNRLAAAFSDSVNQIFTSAGNAPLFVRSSVPERAAASLAVNPNLTQDQMSAADPGPPPTANGIAIRLSGLANPSDSANTLDNLSYSEFFIGLGAQVGTWYMQATNNNELHQTLLVQAQNERQDSTGVSLEQEVVLLLETQRSFEAASRMVRVVDELTQTVLSMVS